MRAYSSAFRLACGCGQSHPRQEAQVARSPSPEIAREFGYAPPPIPPKTRGCGRACRMGISGANQIPLEHRPFLVVTGYQFEKGRKRSGECVECTSLFN